MRWSPQQDEALRRVNEWIKDPSAPQLFRMFGYAGTGKTTLAVHLAQGVEGAVLFGAFTGKAAHVMQSKGCEGASTIHSLIYNAKDKSGNELKRLKREMAEVIAELGEDHPRVKDFQVLIQKEKDSLRRPSFSLNVDSVVKYSDLVIIDECSMVDERMGRDLLSFGTKVLVLGDPAQLPPVGGAGFFTEKVDPEIMLTEIHRQARDNPILELATRARQKEDIHVGDYGDSEVIQAKKIAPELVFQYNQILVGKNETRRASNRRYRSLQDIGDPHPVAGDKLVCLRNNHEEALLNGAIFNIDKVDGIEDGKVFMDIFPDGVTEAQSVVAHVQHFLGQGDSLEWYERKEANEFDYGYALTVHKSQGSQWDRVLLFDESGVFRADKWRWLYTGITRAAEAVTLVKM